MKIEKRPRQGDLGARATSPPEADASSGASVRHDLRRKAEAQVPFPKWKGASQNIGNASSGSRREYSGRSEIAKEASQRPTAGPVARRGSGSFGTSHSSPGRSTRICWSLTQNYTGRSGYCQSKSGLPDYALATETHPSTPRVSGRLD